MLEFQINKAVEVKKRKGVTLAELLIAVVLLLLVFLAVTSVDIASRDFSILTHRKAEVQNEAKIAMEHMIRNMREGVSSVTPTAGSIIVSMPDGTYIMYQKSEERIEFNSNYPTGNWEVIGDRINSLNLTLGSNSLNFVRITITAQYGNQSITLISLVTLRNS